MNTSFPNSIVRAYLGVHEIGASAAFYSDRSGKSQLWVWEKSSGALRQVSKAIVRPYWGWEVVRWTADSRKILTKILPEGMTLEEAVSLIGAPSKQTDQTNKNIQPTVTVYSSSARSKQTVSAQLETNQFLSDLGLIDIYGGNLQRIARAVKCSWYSISPNNTSGIAYTTLKGFEGSNSQQLLYDLVAVSLPDTRSRAVASNVRLSLWGGAVSWSPDGKLLSYIEGGPRAKGDCYLVPVSGGEPRKATKEQHPSFDMWGHSPLWDDSGKELYLVGSDDSLTAREVYARPSQKLSYIATDELWRISVLGGAATSVAKIPNRNLVEIISSGEEGRFWSPDSGQSMYVCTRDDQSKQVGFYKVDLTTGKYAKLIEENKSYSPPLPIPQINVAHNGQSIVYVAEDAQHGPDIWVADTFFRNSRRLTQINPQLDRFVMGASRIIEWRSEDGEPLRGALLLPSGYEEGKRYPLIVYVYGGYYGSNTVNRFGLWDVPGDNMQLLATRGYAVLLPDAPVRRVTPMRDLAKTILPGVNKVVELGIADPNRLGVIGHSYGGYSSLALIVQTTRFKAAICRAGIGNLISMYGQLGETGSSFGVGWAESGQGRMEGSPWEFRERYIENSPFFFLDKVETPLLIVQGTLDPGVPPFLADEVFVGLRRLGKDVTYLKYEGEGHTYWGHVNTLDYGNRMIAWFDKWLKVPNAFSSRPE